MTIPFSCISGTTKIPNLDENIGSVLVNLTSEEVEEIAAAVPSHEVAGSRVGKRPNFDFADTPPLASYEAPDDP